MKKLFVLDTNVLLNDPHSIFKFADNDVIISIAVIEQIDHFKREQSELARSARLVSHLLDDISKRGVLSKGIVLAPDQDKSGTLYINIGRQIERLPQQLSRSVDNHVLALALALQQEQSANKVILVSKDSNLRVKANAFGVEAQDFAADRVASKFSGESRIAVSTEQINVFYDKHRLELADTDLCPNEFVVLEDDQQQQVGAGVYKQGQVHLIDQSQSGVWGVFPRNLGQAFALEVLMDDAVKLVTLSGGAGTGKTMLAIAAGLAKTTDACIYQKLLVARPIFPLGKDLGFLPGDLDEKLNPWMQPIFDNLEFLLGDRNSDRGNDRSNERGGVRRQNRRASSGGYHELIEQGMLAVEPITYIRGRSIPKQYFVVDEAQNLSAHEIKTIITRAGEGTKIVLTGDSQQIDNPYLDDENNGLTRVIECFKHSVIAAHVTLTKGERSELASLAAQLL
ncbi:MAG: PhoH family protein [Pseudomonadota bacterium]|nr:PhoH family protein [Pseudomonadota bacterium]